jgi:hypothetical protein
MKKRHNNGKPVKALVLVSMAALVLYGISVKSAGPFQSMYSSQQKIDNIRQRIGQIKQQLRNFNLDPRQRNRLTMELIQLENELKLRSKPGFVVKS